MSYEDLGKRVKTLEDMYEIQKLHVHYVNCLTTASWQEVWNAFLKIQ